MRKSMLVPRLPLGSLTRSSSPSPKTPKRVKFNLDFIKTDRTQTAEAKNFQKQFPKSERKGSNSSDIVNGETSKKKKMHELLQRISSVKQKASQIRMELDLKKFK